MSAAAPLALGPDPALEPERSPLHEPILLRLLRATVLATCAAALVYDLALPAGALAAGLGAAIAVLASERIARRRLRAPVIVAGALLAPLGACWLADAIVSSAPLARALGIVATVSLADALRFGPGALCLALGSRLLAARSRSVLIAEALVLALAAATIVAPHREGAINRPFSIADPAWMHGYDPGLVFLAIGALAGLALLTLLVRRDRTWRALVDLVVVALLVLGATRLVQTWEPPPPMPTGELGLTGDGKPPADPRGGTPRGARGAGGASGGQSQPPPPTMDFKQEYSNEGKATPVAVVLLHDDLTPPAGAFYFRQAAFSQWNGLRLVAATKDGTDADVPPQFPTARSTVPLDKRWLGARRALDTTIAMLVDHPRPFGLEAPAALEPAPNPDPARFRRVYRVTSQVLAREYAALLGESGFPDDKAHYLEAPDDPRYHELAERVVSRLPARWRHAPLAQALALKEWLEKEGIYSRKTQHEPGPDPTGAFLFGERDHLVGYCVHFAHAMTLLLRSRGIPARVAAGYAVPAENRGAGSSILLRAGDAHAWPEIYLAGAGWVVVDVSPSRTRDEPEPPPDPELQRLMGELARQKPDPPIEDPDRPSHWPSAMDLLRWLGLLGASLGLGLYAAKAYRRLWPLVAPARALPRVAYVGALDALSDAGLRRARGESREAFARRVAADAPAFVALSELHLEAALSARAPAAPAGVRHAPLALLFALGRSRGRLRVLWGLFNPLSFLKVH